MDKPPGAVTLYVTDIARGQKLVDAAKKTHPKIDIGRIKLVVAKFSRRTLDAAIEKIMPPSGDDPAIYTVSPETDGSGITVTAAKDKVAAVQSRLNSEDRHPDGNPGDRGPGRPAQARRRGRHGARQVTGRLRSVIGDEDAGASTSRFGGTS